jgi:hypothetical protein
MIGVVWCYSKRLLGIEGNTKAVSNGVRICMAIKIHVHMRETHLELEMKSSNRS